MRQTSGDRLCKVPGARGSAVYSKLRGVRCSWSAAEAGRTPGPGETQTPGQLCLFLSAVVGRHGAGREGGGIDESRDPARWTVGKGDPGYRCVEKECGARRPHEEAGAGVLSIGEG